MKIINYFKRIKIQKKYPTSRIYISVIFNNKTIFSGYNLISNGVNVNNTELGIGSYISSNSYLPNCKIGKFCSIANNVQVSAYTHPLHNVSTHPSFFNTSNFMPLGKSKNFFKEELVCENGFFINVGNDVWIGEHVIIKGGVSIGDGAVVGAGAVVTKDVPPYSVVAGVPAKIIKYRFNDDLIAKFLEIKWWDWDVDIIKERLDEFTDVEKFIEKYYKD